MIQSRTRIAFAGGVLLLGVAACSSDGPAPATPSEPVVSPQQQVIDRHLNLRLDSPENYADHPWPAHYIPGIVRDNNVPPHNPTTDRGATLGRVLFYDEALSFDRTISCASCHEQELGFTDARVKSIGINGGVTRRHSMRLANAMFYFGREAFWDRHAANFEEQAVLPILDEFEMGFTVDVGGVEALLERMNGLEYYPILFEWVFETSEITRERIELALAQFVRSMISTGSRFDRAAEAEFLRTGVLPFTDLPELPEPARTGFRLYMTMPEDGGVGCVTCHRVPTFGLDANSANNGLDLIQDRIFKAPSLKNVAVTGPYMHDGRFATLREVMDHYAEGVIRSEFLDRRLVREDGRLGLPMTPAQRDAVVAFLETITDEAFLEDPKFSDPFLR